jgi:hypothetical protein
MALGALISAAVRRRGSLEIGLLGFCVALIVAAPLQPLLDPRHMLPVIVALAVLGSLIVADAASAHRRIVVAVDIVLLVTAGYFVVTLKNYRRYLDEPRDTDAVMQAVRSVVPEHETVLSLYTYDTFYHSKRPATWPIPWGQKVHPVEMFLTADCDSVLMALRRHRIRYALVPTSPQGEAFDGANYPRPFITCMAELVQSGRILVPWHSKTAALVEVPPR